jgi:hypothetical protein
MFNCTSYRSVSRWLGRGVLVRLTVKANNPDERGLEGSIPGRVMLQGVAGGPQDGRCEKRGLFSSSLT